MKRAPSCERLKSFVRGFINGKHQSLVLPMDQRERPAVDLVHRTELHHPLVSRLEPSDGRRPNDLYPLSFPFRKLVEHGVTRRGEWRGGLRGT
jgi:hypothetical protein